MNREERRKYISKIKNDKRASICPVCGNKSLFYSAPQLKPYEGTKEKFIAEDFETVIKCEVCNNIVLQRPAIAKLIPPGIYLPLPLDIFQMALKYEEEHPEEAAEIIEEKDNK